MKNQVPSLPDNASYSEQLLYFIANKLCSIDCNLKEFQVAPYLTEDLNDAIKEKSRLNSELNNTSSDQKMTSELEEWLSLKELVMQDSEFKAVFLYDENDSFSIQLLRFIAKSGQWETVTQIWEILAERCKKNKRKASETEMKILVGILFIYNLTFKSQAVLQECDIGAHFDYRTMERVTTTQGERVIDILLPGLLNAGGNLYKAMLVNTQ